MEPTIDDLQAQIDRLNRTIREWREQQAPQPPAEDRLLQLGDRGAEILSRWEATDLRYSQAVNEIEARLAEWGSMESRLHRDAIDRVRTFERTIQGEWQALRQMHEEPLRQLQEQAAALGETCVAAANLSLRGYERAEARLSALENDLRTQLTLLTTEVHTALAEVRRAALPPVAPAEPFQLESVMRLHEELRNAAPFPSETDAPPQRLSEGLRSVETPHVIDVPRATEPVRPVEAARLVETEPAERESIDVAPRPGEAVPRPVEVSWPVDVAPRPMEVARTLESSEPVVLRPRPVLAQMPSAATAPAVAPDVKLPTPLVVAAEAPAVAQKAGPSRLPDSAFPLNEGKDGRRTHRRAEWQVPRRAPALNMFGRVMAGGVALAVIAVGIVVFGRMQPAGPAAEATLPTTSSGVAAASSDSTTGGPVSQVVTPAEAVVSSPAPVVVSMPAPDTAEVAARRSVDILGAPDAVRLVLTGVGPAEGASAQIMWSRAQGMVLSASRLPPLTDGTTYRLSLLGGFGAVPVTAFTPDAAGRARLVVGNPANMPRPVHGAIVTIESATAGAESTGIVALERGTR